MSKPSISAARLRKWAVALRATVDQGEFVPDDEVALLDQIIDDEGALEDLEQQYPLLFNALVRCDEDYAAVVTATSRMECSLDAVDAFVALAQRGGLPPAEDDDETESDGDPDADLDPARN